MSMYIPEIKEEVSENAKMLVEDGGKIVRTGMPKGSGNSSDVDLYVEFEYNSNPVMVVGDYLAIVEKMRSGVLPNICFVDRQENNGENSYALYFVTSVGFVSKSNKTLRIGYLTESQGNNNFIRINENNAVEIEMLD